MIRLNFECQLFYIFTLLFENLFQSYFFPEGKTNYCNQANKGISIEYSLWLILPEYEN
jgi:hypothetical protein